MSQGDTRAGAQQNGAEAYPQQNGYPSQQQYPPMNMAPSNKRIREVDDQEDPYGRPLSAGGDAKRMRTEGGPVGGGPRPISQPHSVKAGGVRR